MILAMFTTDVKCERSNRPYNRIGKALTIRENLSDYCKVDLRGGKPMSPDDVRTGDYITVNIEGNPVELIFSEIDELKTDVYLDKHAGFKSIQAPSKLRQIEDVYLDSSTTKDLRRITPEEYELAVKDIDEAIRKGQVPVLKGVMCTGKSSFAMFYLRKRLGRTLDIVVPNVALAKDLYSSITAAKEALGMEQFSSITIGQSIGSSVTVQDINVVTPGHMSGNNYVMFDEFQQVTVYNVACL